MFENKPAILFCFTLSNVSFLNINCIYSGNLQSYVIIKNKQYIVIFLQTLFQMKRQRSKSKEVDSNIVSKSSDHNAITNQSTLFHLQIDQTSVGGEV